MGYFFVIGKDKRTENIAEMLKKENKYTEDIGSAKYILTTVPFTKDGIKVTGTDILIDNVIKACKGKILFSGAIRENIKKKLEANDVDYYDLMDCDDVALLNAVPTVEGAISIAIEKSDITLSGSNVCVLGFGRIGKIFAKTLSGIGAKVYCEARKEIDLAQIAAMGYNVVDLKDLNEYLSSFDYIFNTIPFMILDKDRLDLVKKDVSIIDVASNPGGVDFDYAREKGINASLELALPSRFAPKSAAIYFKQKIDRIIQDDM